LRFFTVGNLDDTANSTKIDAADLVAHEPARITYQAQDVALRDRRRQRFQIEKGHERLTDPSNAANSSRDAVPGYLNDGFSDKLRMRSVNMVESETNQGVVYDGYTATAQYDASYLPATIVDEKNQPAKEVRPDKDDGCDPPTVVERKPKE
jgi:hypothetical protein